MPERVQLQRTKGWRMPPNTVKVDRSTRWGNPWVVGQPHPWPEEGGRPMTAADAVELYALHAGPAGNLEGVADEAALLVGCNLACWCPLDQPCHADVLLSLANGPGTA